MQALKLWWWKLREYRPAQVLRWLPLLAQDRQWDYIYLVLVVRFKLRLMEARFKSPHTPRQDAPTMAAQIQRAREAADRLIADDYLHLALIPHEARWGEMEFDIRDDIIHGVRFSLATTPEEQAQAHAEYRAAGRAADAVEAADWALLWDTIKNHGQEWWD